MRFIKHNAKKWYYIGFAAALALVPAPHRSSRRRLKLRVTQALGRPAIAPGGFPNYPQSKRNAPANLAGAF